MAYSKAFFDANVLIEVVMRRQAAQRVVKFQQNLGSTELTCSTLTGHLVMYFCSKNYETPYLRDYLSNYSLLSLTETDFAWAFDNARSDDFEDALQIAVAIRSGCDSFVTFDKQLAQTYDNLPTLKMQLL